MKITAEPRSDQWNADDFIGGPRTFTIVDVVESAAEQKYDIALEGETRAWRPPLTMIRVLLKAWGDESDTWVGRRVTLYQDPTITFGREVLGGIRISHLSGISGPLNVKVTATRGKRVTVSVQPLPDEPAIEPVDWSAEADKLKGNTDALRALYTTAQQHKATPEQLAHIKTCATPEPTQEAAPE